MIFDQSEFELRCEWGSHGVAELAPISDIVIIVDVLSFSTCVEVATRNDAVIFPYQWKDESAIAYAQSVNAELASRDRQIGYSLSPASLVSIPAKTRLVLPSPNGATLTLAAGHTLTLAGCLRNCAAVAQFAQQQGKQIAVISAGERWEDGSLRPALEDWLGAGAILSFLQGRVSPEAEAAIAVFNRFKDNLLQTLSKCSSGKELIAKGFSTDVELASEFNVSDCVPQFTQGAYSSKDKG